jgi:hypothetical protein
LEILSSTILLMARKIRKLNKRHLKMGFVAPKILGYEGQTVSSYRSYMGQATAKQGVDTLLLFTQQFKSSTLVAPAMMKTSYLVALPPEVMTENRIHHNRRPITSEATKATRMQSSPLNMKILSCFPFTWMQVKATKMRSSHTVSTGKPIPTLTCSARVSSAAAPVQALSILIRAPRDALLV